jgi:apolipoprotein N-acyltransferase
MLYSNLDFEKSMEPNYLDLDPEERINKILAFLSVILGASSICAGLYPPLGIIAGVISLFSGIRGRRSASRKVATLGILISAFAITLSVIYWIFLAIKKYLETSAG